MAAQLAEIRLRRGGGGGRGLGRGRFFRKTLNKKHALSAFLVRAIISATSVEIDSFKTIAPGVILRRCRAIFFF